MKRAFRLGCPFLLQRFDSKCDLEACFNDLNMIDVKILKIMFNQRLIINSIKKAQISNIEIRTLVML